MTFPKKMTKILVVIRLNTIIFVTVTVTFLWLLLIMTRSDIKTSKIETLDILMDLER